MLSEIQSLSASPGRCPERVYKVRVRVQDEQSYEVRLGGEDEPSASACRSIHGYTITRARVQHESRVRERVRVSRSLISDAANWYSAGFTRGRRCPSGTTPPRLYFVTKSYKDGGLHYVRSVWRTAVSVCCGEALSSAKGVTLAVRCAPGAGAGRRALGAGQS